MCGVTFVSNAVARTPSRSMMNWASICADDDNGVAASGRSTNATRPSKRPRSVAINAATSSRQGSQFEAPKTTRLGPSSQAEASRPVGRPAANSGGVWLPAARPSRGGGVCKEPSSLDIRRVTPMASNTATSANRMATAATESARSSKGPYLLSLATVRMSVTHEMAVSPTARRRVGGPSVSCRIAPKQPHSPRHPADHATA